MIFPGKEMLQQALLDAPKFGNDNEEADEIAVRLHEFICQTIRNQKKPDTAGFFPGGVDQQQYECDAGAVYRRDAGRQKCA